MLFHKVFIIRELVHAKKQALIFILCAALSISSLATLNTFKNKVNQSILNDAKALHGGDLIIHSHYELHKRIKDEISRLKKLHNLEISNTHEFYSVVQNIEKTSSLLSKIKIVDQRYPLYGQARLKSNKDFNQVLQEGKIIVEQNILDRLGLELGDKLHVGSAILEIADIIFHEPDRPVNFFSFGPRIFVSAKDLHKVDLIKKGSRIQYTALLKINDHGQLNQITTGLENAAHPEQERVETYKTARSRVKNFFDNLLFFLSLISIFTLLLAGIGMQSSLIAMLREKEKSMAIIKSIGTDSRFLLSNYTAIVLILGTIGISLGIINGFILEKFLAYLFKDFMPIVDKAVDISFAEDLFIGFAAIVIFSFLPILKITSVKPAVIFRHGKLEAKNKRTSYILLLAGFILIAIMSIRHLHDLKISIIFISGSLLLIGIISLLTHLLLRFLTGLKFSTLPVRLAVKSLLRPGNATKSIIITLAASISVLLTIFLVEENLKSNFISSYPEDAPNIYFLDIQPAQKDSFIKEIGKKIELYPIIRARLSSINGHSIDRKKELKRKRDNLLREFNLTQRNSLLSDEVIIKGQNLFRENWPKDKPIQVSILDTVAEMGIQMNDIISFNIQGVELSAQVTSIRTRTRSKLYPYFYFVFPDNALGEAPKTYFAALKLDQNQIHLSQNNIISLFPNISLINMSETINDLGGLLIKLTKIINFFALFSLMAGTLIIISSIFATRLARIKEAVYYKILGSPASFLFYCLLYENSILGFISALLGVIIAQIGSWAACRFLFEISYNFFLPSSVIIVFICIFAVTFIGLLSSLKMIRQKPADYLREQDC